MHEQKVSVGEVKKQQIKMQVIVVLLTVLLLSVPVHPAFAWDERQARQIVAEMNLARTNPLKYAGLLREFRKNFQGKSYRLPSANVMVQTREGVAAVDEAIRFLSRQKPLPPLTWSSGLAAAAEELVREQGDSGETGHGNGRSNGMRERVERHGRWEGRIGENIAYGPRDPRSVVMQLIIDDGVPGRGHRKNHFNPAFGAAGAACGPHPGFGSVCVIDFASRFSD